MRVLIVNIYYYPNNVGGTESVVQMLAEGLVKSGASVAVFTGDGNQERIYKEEINGVRVYRGVKGKYVMPNAGETNPLNIKIRNNIRNRCNLSVKKELDYVCDDFCPDVIHTHNLVGLSTQIWRYCKEKKLPVIHTLHDYWLQDARFKLFGRNNAKYVNAVTAPSEFVVTKFKTDRYFPSGNYYVIPNGIDLDAEHLTQLVKQKLQKSNEEPVQFLYVGQLGSIKGLDHLLRNFSKWENHNVKLAICGKGFLENEVIEAAEKDPRIHYYGQLTRLELAKVYEASDVLVAPSVWDEPFGMVAIEAYANALIVVAGNRGGLADIVSDIGVGRLIEPTIETEMIDAFETYSVRDNIKSEIGFIDRKISQFSLEKQIASFLGLYNQLLA